MPVRLDSGSCSLERIKKAPEIHMDLWGLRSRFTLSCRNIGTRTQDLFNVTEAL